MMDTDIEHLKYPVGNFIKPDVITAYQIQTWIQEIKDFPILLEQELKDLDAKDYEKTYRPGGWNITQLVHHLADSHMNSFIRYKLSLTEEHPTIKPYLEDLWGEMDDNKLLSAEISLAILIPLHARWSYLLDQLKPEDFLRGYIHPQKNRLVDRAEVTALYAWHCRHHLAHIRNAKSN